MPSVKISDLAAASSLSLTHQIETESAEGVSEKTTLGAVKSLVSSSLSYASTYWYWLTPSTAGTNTASPTMNTIYFVPIFLPGSVTLDQIGVRMSSGSTSGNVSLAIYAANALGKPTGPALGFTAATANTSTSANVTASLSSNVTLAANTLYFVGVNSSTSTGQFAGMVAAATIFGFYTGATSAANLTGNNNGQPYEVSNQYTLAQTFGTWPDVTASTFTNTGGSATRWPYIMARAV